MPSGAERVPDDPSSGLELALPLFRRKRKRPSVEASPVERQLEAFRREARSAAPDRSALPALLTAELDALGLSWREKPAPADEPPRFALATEAGEVGAGFTDDWEAFDLVELVAEDEPRSMARCQELLEVNVSSDESYLAFAQPEAGTALGLRSVVPILAAGTGALAQSLESFLRALEAFRAAAPTPSGARDPETGTMAARQGTDAEAASRQDTLERLSAALEAIGLSWDGGADPFRLEIESPAAPLRLYVRPDGAGVDARILVEDIRVKSGLDGDFYAYFLNRSAYNGAFYCLTRQESDGAILLWSSAYLGVEALQAGPLAYTLANVLFEERLWRRNAAS